MDSGSVTDTRTPQGRMLDTPPPRPPKGNQSLVAMAAGPTEAGAVDMSSPAIQAMSAMGEARNALMKLSTYLPPLAPGIQQVISGLESVVPQMVADIVAGNPPGSSGAGMGAPQANQAPAAPPVQAGAP